MLDTKALAEATAAIVREHVDKAVAPLVAENAGLRDRIKALEDREPQQGQPGRDGADGRDGKDADPEAIRALVAEAVSALPLPKDGEKGADGRDGADGKDGADGADGKDGAGIADLLIDREGNLVASFTDGRMKNLGAVSGKDGADGAAGRDGIDGFGFEDLSVEQTGERAFTLRFSKGERTKEFELAMPVVIDRGVWREGKAYEAGDAVTWGGSLWIAQKGTEAKPDGGDGWRLAVKRGRDGKDKA